MSTQSEAALEAGLIATLRQMDYEYVQIVEEDNLYVNFKRQLEIHNKKQLAEVGRTSFTDEEFEKILIYLARQKVELALKRPRNFVTSIRLIW
jgi:type I restriction enzyme R subunit